MAQWFRQRNRLIRFTDAYGRLDGEALGLRKLADPYTHICFDKQWPAADDIRHLLRPRLLQKLIQADGFRL
jgi:hypothetical protein